MIYRFNADGGCESLCGGACQFGFVTDIPPDGDNQDPKQVFPSGSESNGFVDETNINLNVFGTSGSDPLSVLLLGNKWYDESGSGTPFVPICELSPNPNAAFIAEIKTFIENGGSVLIVGENKTDSERFCLDSADFTQLNNLIDDLNGTIHFSDTLPNVDDGCQTSNHLTSPAHELADGLTKFGLGGSTWFESATGGSIGDETILLSNDTDGNGDRFPVILAEHPVYDSVTAQGWIVYFADANMFNCGGDPQTFGDLPDLLARLCK